jgi:hypothetical protein
MAEAPNKPALQSKPADPADINEISYLFTLAYREQKAL